MEIRLLNEKDARNFYDFLKELDKETEYMMYEPDERIWSEEQMYKILGNRDNLFLGAFIDEEIIGFLSAERGNFRRINHSACIVIGIKEKYHCQGIGMKLFKRLDSWAKVNKIKRLELTAETDNIGAIKLYEKSGFVIEGRKIKSMFVNGNYVDEYYMAKVFK